MNDFTPEIITSTTVAPQRRFPVAYQLGILGVLLLVLFAALLIPAKDPVGVTEMLKSPEPRETATASVTIAPITAIDVTGESVFVLDVRTNRVLYAKNPDKVLPLASITKLMTSLLTTEVIPDTTVINVNRRAVAQDGASGLASGDSLQAGELRNYAMLASSNDAAYALSVAAGSVLRPNDGASAFIEAMNIRAEELGLTSMRFYNATGLDLSPTEAGAYGSARDVSFLMAHILDTYPEILRETTVEQYTIYDESGAYHNAENTNPAITAIPNLLGSKTGYTDLAGGNLTIAYNAGFDRPIIITVLGSTFNERFTDIERIIAAITEATVTSQ
jgi:D-alanyl-D-alanine carboxypeptidase